MNEYNLNSGNYWEEVERVQNEIWANINVKGVTVIDVGVGESTQQLVKLGANVIGIDIDVKKVERFLKLNIPMIVCDFMNAPFRREIADLVVFYFTLHEVDPAIHDKILHVAKEIAPLVMIVEPSPYGCPTYEKYAEIWRKAMHSVGRFEDYKPLEYWANLLLRTGFKIVFKKTIKWNTGIPYRVFEKIIAETIDEWKRLNVEEEYIMELKDLLKEVKTKGIRWSNINVILAENVGEV